jgi:hypothetical protein
MKDSIEDAHIAPDQVVPLPYSDVSSVHKWLYGHYLRECPGTECPGLRDLIAAENRPMPEVYASGYEDAPKWYWRIAAHFTGWRGEVEGWALFFALGMLAGLFISALAILWALTW